MKKPFQDNSGSARDIAADAGMKNDEEKTIGELMREMNISQAGISASKTTGGSVLDPQKPVSIGTKDADINSKRKTKIVELNEKKSENEKNQKKLKDMDFMLLINSLRKLVNILRERGDKNLNVLIRESAESAIMQSANAIERILSEEKTDFADLDAEIKKIISSLEMIGTGRQRGGLREDTENLAKAKLVLGQIELGCHDVIIRTVKDGSPEIKMIMASIGKLFNVAQEKKFYVSKLLTDFDGFHRR